MKNFLHITYRRLCITTLLLSATIASLFIYPHIFGNNITCFWQGTIGFPCPGCGMTRAFSALIQGDFALAWQMHPMIFIAPPLLFLYFYYIRKKEKKKGDSMLILLICLFFLTWILRLIFMFPTQEPMTPNEHPLFHLFHLFF